ncbi:uncharacterized protein [Oryza sativa Japonica Group]|uniref:Os07g0110100 protein n=3 Tax=Oryza sativa TaxID=4530 RepID=B9FV59_ORYSJ|nr:uncharacterized protein LOC4342224 [Oryza sativa Japonica Group]EEC81401.1 hypothetical protein OsI_24630 [Oryza sativa Indica Group]KAB8104079.1 hypothetical protein EE612_036726 [Oryza sativa]EEE66446.1 hypothetical protein OsJ_22831 [Oryza sativa Japonica Group]KAF2921132.1 hypothetical protein DAI22_07g007200 [Oryza sativa Japonica Group]BAC06945.1 unknown protein [Oryza sativa Japonica Group]|eukprot:NP_001058729.1 Os07g0110100 [Oryza sativa Japonica Group]
MVAWTLRPAAAGRAIRRAAYHSDGAPPPRKLRGPRFSSFNRNNHEIDALLEEVKNTPVNMITDDLMIRTVRHSFLARQEILYQNVLRSWVVVAAVLTGYSWGYNKFAESSTVGSEPPKEHEGK